MMKPFRWSLVASVCAAIAMSFGCNDGNQGTFEEATSGAAETTYNPDAPSTYDQYQQQGGMASDVPSGYPGSQ
ncbi:hypothetical protein [Tautonia rosea]|uniref:hypothetical protein n=1 Tax=Tautonia rosea TaxID=2728037 RepID=UPI001475A09B|nr:hypothetical protein [Tautonia rosea]